MDVVELKSLHAYIIKWNTLASDGQLSSGGQDIASGKPAAITIHIHSERLINQIWSRIQQFSTMPARWRQPKKVIQQCCHCFGVQLKFCVINVNASGPAFCM